MAIPLIETDVALDGLNSLRLAARAERYCRIDAVEQLSALFETPCWGQGPSLILGGGSNLVLSGDIAGLVLHITTKGITFDRSDPRATLVTVAAGESWDGLVQATIAQGEGGLENLISIPGLCGAAPVQNIGAYGLELADRLSALEAFDCRSGQLRTLTHAECQFAYRDSVFKRAPGRYIITGLTLTLPRPWRAVLSYRDLAGLDPSSSAHQIAAAVAAIRASKLPDPAVIGNVGSFFKNPIVSAGQFAALQHTEPGIIGYPQADGTIKLAAAWLIDRSGLKGARRGDAAVHEHQALVIINRGSATADDVLGLAEHVRSVVKERFEVELEQEPVLV